jgi:hypothetical protein
MCPTVLGRIETRVATITLPAIFATIISLATWDASWIALIGMYLLLGIALDVCVYSWLFRYQPPWMTLVLAVAEFGLLYLLVVVLDDIDLTLWETIVVYWVSWILAIWTKIVALPLLSLTYLESAGEFRRSEWSVPPQQQELPIIAAVPSEPAAPVRVAEPAPVLAAAAGTHARGDVPEPEPVPAAIRHELEATGAVGRPSVPFRPEGPPRRRGSAARRGWMIIYSYALVVATFAAEAYYFAIH